MTSGDEVFDPGLQPERTALAWRRTGLALAVAAAGASRLTAPRFGLLALLLGALGVLAAAVVVLGGGFWYRAAHLSLRTHGDLRQANSAGAPIAVVAIGTGLVGLMCLAFVLGPDTLVDGVAGSASDVPPGG